jgi:hypothetical protein
MSAEYGVLSVEGILAVSPHSGRMIVAQQFTAGRMSERIVVREADG